MTDRPDPPTSGPEAVQLRAWLDFHRQTLKQKAAGLTQEELARPLAPSTLTLGGLLKHMALVEDNWFSVVLLGREDAAPWQGVDWEGDPDWEFRTAADDSPEVLLGLLDDAIAASDRILDKIGDDLDTVAKVASRHTGQPFDLRWILIHMIEEYARHNGHADLIRESVDGATGA
ncbi:DinB family protein [Nocardioides currus]|uniref:Mini-circle protein n=1 Tax=Nocardioides currus TaxID=2133958 RepID=A0A2R7Z114_9ACTN|nr:DinB family protein [Nocardioides currus]PUA82312.1 mini-circle protein [Nocardioides currus]